MMVVISANRHAHQMNQVKHTMTVGEMIDTLSQFDKEAKVVIGNDSTDYGWYTYGGISEEDFYEMKGE